jgi:nucleoid DNA-binding protein
MSNSTDPEETRAALSPQLVSEMVEALMRNGQFRITNFGVFELKMHKARKGRNPRTGSGITIPRKLGIAFRPSRALQARLDEEIARMEDSEESPRKAKGESRKRWWPFG